MKKMAVFICAAVIAAMLSSCNDSGNGNTGQGYNGSGYQLNVYKNPANGGTININGVNNAPAASVRAAGETITLIAVPASGYTFQNWQAAAGSLPAFTQGSVTNPVVTFKMNSNAYITANFTGGSGGGGGGGDGNGSVTTYPFPNGMSKYNGITVTAGGHNIDLYSVRANSARIYRTNTEDQATMQYIPIAMFDMSGSVKIEVTVSSPSGVVVRPRELNISPSVSGNKISFNIPKAGQYSVEWSNLANNPRNCVLIFANPVENFSGTRTLGQGIHGNQEVHPGETLVLQPGAVVRGKIFMNSNSKLVGRGIIDGSHLRNYNNGGGGVTLPIETWQANNVEIRGISIFDPNAWTVQLQNTSNVTIDNLKIVSSRCNSDGISIQSSDNVTITNSFFRTWDDGITLKIYQNRNTYNVNVRNCIFWTDLAQCMEIGYETNKNGSNGNPRIYDSTFENITVFHALHKPVISIHNGDNAAVAGITFKNIVVENYQCGEGDGLNYLIDFNNLWNRDFSTVSARGSISNCRVENVRVLGGKNPSARFSSAGGGSINGITIKDIYVNGEKKGQFGTVSSASISWQ